VAENGSTEPKTGVAAVTGTSGRVGAAVARALEAAGWPVRGLDRIPGRHTDVVGDLRDGPSRRALLHAAEVVVHAAALHAPHVGLVDDAEFRSVNVDGTAALLTDAAATGVRRFVLISSTSVYGNAMVPADRAVWVDESLRPQPRDIYDETKLAAEQLVTAGPVEAVTDVATATVSAAAHESVTGTFTIAGRYPFTRDDCVALHHDAAGVIAERAPEVATAFHDRGWPLPRRIDRVYDSAAATRAFGYQPRAAVLDLLRDPGGFD
jgi:UDP-glucose 4-epimerase